MINKLLMFCFLVLSVSVFGLSGKVFIDRNNNVSCDKEEIGYGNCYVSDGRKIVKPDGQGNFEIDTETDFVFIILPDGYNCRKWFYRADSEDEINFPLIKKEKKNLFMVVADPHYASSPEQMNKMLKDRQMKISPDIILKKLDEKIEKLQPDFIIVLGDMGASIRDLKPDEAKECLKEFNKYFNFNNIPVYFSVGNHEICSKSENPTQVYEEIYGPTYYSFNSNGTHYVVLNTHVVNNKNLKYGIDDVQLNWFKKDLATVGTQTPIVVFSHEPFCDLVQSENNSELIDLFIRYNINAHISGHWHQQRILEDKSFWEITCGSLCGGWWEGPSPTSEEFGYSLFSIDRGKVNYGFFNVDSRISTWFDLPNTGIYSGIIDVRVVTSEPVDDSVITIDDEIWPFAPLKVNRGFWTEYYYKLNISNLETGAHKLKFKNGKGSECCKSIWIDNNTVTIKQLTDDYECFLGKDVFVNNAKQDVAWGNYTAFNDETGTLMARTGNLKLPFNMSENDTYVVNGIYRHPRKVIDPLKMYKNEGIVKKKSGAVK